MVIIKQAIAYLNTGQTQVDVCDQPVFCPDRRNSKRYPKKFGSGSYFCLCGGSGSYFSLFGGIHLEECMLSIYGELIKRQRFKKCQILKCQL